MEKEKNGSAENPASELQLRHLRAQGGWDKGSVGVVCKQSQAAAARIL